MNRVNLITFVCITFTLMIGVSDYGTKAEEHKAAKGSSTWKIDNLSEIGGNPVTVIGNPQVINAPGGKAVLFDGTDDGLLVNANPIAGARAFTLEVVFRPDSNGNKEQRWFHIQEETGDDRVLLEIRLTGDQWFLDTFIKSGQNSRTLYAQDFKHPLGEWYHVALVFDGSEMRHYVDGKEELSGPLTIQPLENGRASIGVRMNRVHWFKGAVQEARFTPRALTPKEFMRKK